MENYKFKGNYKEQMLEILKDRTDELKNTPREERIKMLDMLIDLYVEQTGDRPSDKANSIMADLVLHEELSDKHPDKMTREDNPITSVWQEERRNNPKKAKKTKTGNNRLEVPLENGRHVATDGEDYTPANRTFNNPW